MASASKKKKVDQTLLRDMMKKEQTKSSHQQRKIDSPFAKYNSVGQLLCSLCQCPVKTDKLWLAHISGRTHKEKVAELKRLQENVNQLGAQQQPQRVGTSSESSDGARSGKRVKSASERAGEVKLTHLAHYDDDSDTESMDVTSSDKAETPKPDEANSALPSDFFDAGSQQSESNTVAPAVDSETQMPETKSMADKLPEGFFDNPVKDARVREVKYVDAVEEEWERFQKAIAEEAQVSAHLVEEEDESEVTKRQLSEIDEQIRYWSRVHSLEERKDEIHKGKAAAGEGQPVASGSQQGADPVVTEDTSEPARDQQMDTESSDIDEDDLDALDNWKSKGLKK